MLWTTEGFSAITNCFEIKRGVNGKRKEIRKINTVKDKMLANYSNPEYKFFATKRFAIFTVLYVLINLTACIAGSNSSSPEMSFATSQIMGVTFFVPIFVMGIPIMVKRCEKYINKRPNIVKRIGEILSTIVIVAFFIFAAGHFVLRGINAVDDISSKPQYLIGTVESITSHYKSYTTVYLVESTNNYEYHTFGMDAHIGEKYRFRYLIKSRALYPVEKIS